MWSFYQSPAGLKMASLSVPRPGETAYICVIHGLYRRFSQLEMKIPLSGRLEEDLISK